MAGHNKWSKIKHKKAVTDAAKSRIFSKHAALITIAARDAGGDLASPALAAVIERAKKDSMPKENIERAIAKGSGANAANLEEVMFETFGPGGTAIIATGLTDNNNRTNQEIRHLLSKMGYTLGAPGSALWAFKKTDDGYEPAMPIELSEEDRDKLDTLLEALEENPDIQQVFTTADIAEE